jgi:hypothetical protein
MKSGYTGTRLQYPYVFEMIGKSQPDWCILSKKAEDGRYFSLVERETERAEKVLAPVLAAWDAEVIDEMSQQVQIKTCARWSFPIHRSFGDRHVSDVNLAALLSDMAPDECCGVYRGGLSIVGFYWRMGEEHNRPI